MTQAAQTTGHRPKHGDDATSDAWAGLCRAAQAALPSGRLVVAPDCSLQTFDGRMLRGGDEVVLARDFTDTPGGSMKKHGGTVTVPAGTAAGALDRLVDARIILRR